MTLGLTVKLWMEFCQIEICEWLIVQFVLGAWMTCAACWSELCNYLSEWSGFRTPEFHWHSVSVSSNLNLFLTNTQLFISQDVNWWTEVVWITCRLSWCFYQLFGPSFWWHPFTAEDQLVNKRCNAKFLQLWSHEKLWPLGEFIFSKLSFLGCHMFRVTTF